jgi:hypothetical protein
MIIVEKHIVLVIRYNDLYYTRIQKLNDIEWWVSKLSWNSSDKRRIGTHFGEFDELEKIFQNSIRCKKIERILK